VVVDELVEVSEQSHSFALRLSHVSLTLLLEVHATTTSTLTLPDASTEMF